MRKLRPGNGKPEPATASDANAEAALLRPSEAGPVFLLLWDPGAESSRSMAEAVRAAVDKSEGRAGFCVAEVAPNPRLVQWLRGEELEGVVPELYVVIRRRSGRPYTGAAEPEGVLAFLGECIQAEAAARLEEITESGPVEIVARAAQDSGHPMAVIALSIMRLVENGAIDEADLELIGLTGDELVQLQQAFEYNSTLETFEQELETYAKLRTYRAQLRDIAIEAGVAGDAAKRADLQHALVEFALENDMRDLKKAFRFMGAGKPRD